MKSQFKTMGWIALLWLLGPTIALGQEVYFDPSQVTLSKAGESFTVDIKVKEVKDLFGFELSFLYDKSALRLESIEEGDFLKSDGAATFKIDTKDAEGDLNGAAITRLAKKGVDGEGVILKVKFSVVEPKEGKVEVEVKLSDSKAQKILPVKTYPLIIMFALGEPVIMEHTEGSPMLALQARFPRENLPGKAYIDVWKGSFDVKKGMFLEYQIYMPSGNPHFRAGVEIHTSDGLILGAISDPKPVDQNGLSSAPSTDLSQAARDRWYHRKISLDALAGKTIDVIMLATESSKHEPGLFRAYVDNIQITDGKVRLLDVYIDEDAVPVTGTPESSLADVIPPEGVEDAKVSIEKEVAVEPAGKSIAIWAEIKLSASCFKPRSER